MPNSIQLTDQNSEIKFFYEDVVYRVRKKGNLQLGMVVENSEFASSDDDTSDEEEEKLQKGTIRVAWHPSGEEQVLQETKVGLADRSLMPGDVVRRLIKGKETQRGYCRHVNVHASCLIVGTTQVIYGIKSEKLLPLDQFTADVAVCLDEWVGMIRHIKSKITVRFIYSGNRDVKEKYITGDGKSIESVCILSDAVAEELEDVLDKRDEECEFRRYDFYEGQVLSGPLNVFEGAEFISCSDELHAIRKKSKNKNKTMKVVVEKVEVEGLSIHWQCRAMNTAVKSINEVDIQQPSDYITGDDLKRVNMLNVFEPCTLQIGDRHFYTLKDNDIILLQNDWKKLEKESILRAKDSNTITNSSKLPKYPEIDKSTSGTNESSCSTVMPINGASQGDTNNISNDTNEALLTTVIQKRKETFLVEDDKISENESLTSESSFEENASVEHITNNSSKSNKQRSRTSSGTGVTVQTVTVSASQISNRGQKKKKKLKKSKTLISKELGIDISTVKDFASQLNIVQPGDKLVVETIATHSEATVVWQDGAIEPGIPSRELFPILHLDEQEFFSGDYVIRSSSGSAEDAFDPHCYGVVQSVDHFDRICMVHWYRNYTTESSESRPVFCGKTEEPVYDLKDHPDFKYRPGSIVIRVANFSQCDSRDLSTDSENTIISGSGGQVLDNYPSGKILVWWPNDQTSECWPQDLYKIGEYDSDEGELWEDDNDDISEESWETESEDSDVDLEDESVGEKITSQSEEMDEKEDENTKARLAANIEKARISMARLEEIFQGNPTLQTTTVMKQLLDVYKGCKTLDKLMETTFFDEENFEGLVENLKEFLKYPPMGHQQALQEQFTRLFSASMPDESSKEENEECMMQNDSAGNSQSEAPKLINKCDTQQASVDTASNLGNQIKNLENNLKNQASQNIDENLRKNQSIAHQTCSRLCSLVKAQLLKSHEEVLNRYGGQSTAFTQEDLEQNPGEDQAELDEIMIQILKDGYMDTKVNQEVEEPKFPKDGSAVRPKLNRGVSDYEIAGKLEFPTILEYT